MNEEEKNNNNIIVIVCVFLIIISLLCIVYFVFFNNNQKSKKMENISLTEGEANTLIDSVPIPSKYVGWSDSAYLDKKVLIADMDANHLIYNAMKATTFGEECNEELIKQNGSCDFTFKVDEVRETLDNLYGKDVVPLLDKIEKNLLWKCSRVGDTYGCSVSTSKFCATNVSYYLRGDHFVKYQRAEKDGNYLYLIVKFARIEADYGGNECNEQLKPENVKIQLFKYDSLEEKMVTDTINGSKYYEEKADKTLSEKLYEEFGKKYTDYKITYKINGEHYSLVSVEPIN